MKVLEKIFWKIFPFLLFLPVLLIIVFIFHHYWSLVPRHNIKTSVGTVIGYNKGSKSRTAVIEFLCKNKSFYTQTNDSFYIGEKFIVEYDEKNPEANRVRLDKPIFLKSEQTNITTGIINTYNPNYFREISFIYFIYGEKYEQSYKPVENSELKYPDLREGKKYKVKYWKLNPKRSIILLDQPSNERLVY